MKIIDFLEYELVDDESEHGGIAFLGEKVKDIFDEHNACTDKENILYLSDDIEKLNEILIDCGIKPLGREEQ